MSDSSFQKCSVCGAETPASEMLAYGDTQVCSRCQPTYAQQLREGVQPGQAGVSEADKLPMFPKVMVIVDLVFCVIRGPLVLLGFVGAAMLMRQGQSNAMVIVALEILSGIGIFVAGLAANIMMLMRKKAGAYVAFLNILATVVSIGVGVIQAMENLGKFQPGTPEYVGGIIGGGFAILVRIGLLLAYCFAVFSFMGWCNDREAAMRARTR